MIAHGGGCGEPDGALLPQEIHRLSGDGAAKGEIGVLEVGEELPERPRVHHRAGEAVVAQPLAFFQDTDLDVAQPTALLLVALDHLRQVDGAAQARGAATDEQHVQLDGVGARRALHHQSLLR